ncbi:Aspartyl/Asparaginyl beta-hydroxylase [Pedobacter terrae]|uniref:Aspartyl/Asparaginyl beta-hydroxylase n=1 Tax=Pedobacter terrae TaxID=405671 RepID=A0A1G8DNT4_9SPHI|nr:aspartyl/asparaginyl beta-hydroxylase domain-containing protein [Pedobacter terrae]SDH59275.1 Aspartyl/Asparaginyl beta-hydroxylase [Pedobacter terrae]
MVIYSKVNLAVPTSQIQDQLKQIKSDWINHFNTAHYQGSWTVFPLRTPGGADSIIPDLGAADHYQDHPNMLLFPAVKQLINEMRCEIMAVRLLNLAAGAVIKQHCDADLAFEKGEARLHFPLQTNPDVAFYVNNDRVIMNEGECWYINANLPHRVTNFGHSDRIHLVVDCKVNSWLEHFILDSKLIAHAPDQKRDPELLKQMIAALKMHQTAHSFKMATEFQKEYDDLINSKA